MSKIKQLVKTIWDDVFSLKGYVEGESQIEDEIRQGITFRGSQAYILVFAILVASLGLNTNSTAVIIGAMLISPLMGPIIGIGLAIGINDFDLLRRSGRNLLIAAAISVAASTVFFLISPVAEGHSELLARTQPTIYDVLIAFFGGAAGIVGMSARSKGNVVPGVAIATALMPPLCTVGYGIATWQPDYFLGASYLFIINSIFIALATYIGVKLLRFSTVKAQDPARARRVRRWVYTIAVLALLPSIYLTYTMIRQNTFELNAQRFVAREMNFSGTQVLSETATDKDGRRSLEVVLVGRLMSQDSLMAALTPRMAHYGLGGVKLTVIQGGHSVITKVSDNATVTEVFNAAQKTLQERQATIDSLHSVLAGVERRDSISSVMAPELKIVFPALEDISISRNVFCNVQTGVRDTTELALVRFSRDVSDAERNKLREYIEARIQVRNVKLIFI